jgi:RNA polymerase sigma-70 factor (ECF subfamily)
VSDVLEHDAPTDEALMTRVQAGDPAAFATLYDRHAARAFRVARAICGDRSSAEDAVAEGFQVIWNSRSTFSAGRESFRAWAMKIIRDRATDSAYFADNTLPSLLQRLPDSQAEVIVLAFYGGLSPEEIAAQLELPPGTVKGRMRLGLEQLRRELARSDRHPEG